MSQQPLMSDAPKASNPPMTTRQLYRRLLRYSLAHWPLFAASIIALLVAAATEPLFAALMKPIIDENFSAQTSGLAKYLPFLIVLLFVVRGLASYVNEYCSAKLANLVVQTLRSEMVDRVLQFPGQYFVKQPAGRLISTISAQVDAVTDAGFNIVTVLVRDGAVVLGLLAMLLYTNWRLTLICFAMIPLVAVGVVWAAKRLNRFAHHAQHAHADLVQALTEVVRAHASIKVYGAQQQEHQRFANSAAEIAKAKLKLVGTSAANSAFVQLLVAIAVAVVVYYAGHMASQKTMTAGDFASFITAMMMLLSPIKRLTSINQQLQRGLVAAQSVFNLLDTPVEPNIGKHTVPRAQGHIVFDGVGFAYPDAQQMVLNDIDLNVSPGQTIGIVGPSGSGKSTLIQMLPAFLHPTKGCIYLDGVPLTDWDLNNLRSHIAMVTQEPHLFNDTVRNNIAYGQLRQHTDAEIIAAAKAANAWGFIEALEQGLDTTLGDAGMRLSGGQRQRIAIARAFLKNAPILILDEATSALDSASEREVTEALERLSVGRTTWVVAHRLSTLVNAGHILVLDNGKVAEEGSHAELMAINGTYARLYASHVAGRIPNNAE